MQAKRLLGKHKTLRRMEIRCILPVEMVIILETGILCISFGFYKRILLLRVLGIWCPSPHLKKGKSFSETGSVIVQMKGREGTYHFVLTVGLKSV